MKFYLNESQLIQELGLNPKLYTFDSETNTVSRINPLKETTKKQNKTINLFSFISTSLSKSVSSIKDTHEYAYLQYFASKQHLKISTILETTDRCDVYGKRVLLSQNNSIKLYNIKGKQRFLTTSLILNKNISFEKVYLSDKYSFFVLLSDILVLHEDNGRLFGFYCRVPSKEPITCLKEHSNVLFISADKSSALTSSFRSKASNATCNKRIRSRCKNFNKKQQKVEF